MPAPSQLPQWNTGGANRTEPSAGKKVLGWVVGEAIDSSFFNWFMFRVYEWCAYLSTLTNEALTWAAAQIFSNGITVSTSIVNGNATTSNANGTGAGVRGNASASTGSKGVHGFTTTAGTVGVLGDDQSVGGGKGVRGSSSAGIGVEGSSGSGPAGSFVNSHNVPNDWPTLYAYNDSVGDVAVFTAEGGVALKVFGGESNHAAEFRGNSAGLTALRAYATAAGQSGARFEGETGNTGGLGAEFYGGSPVTGAGAAGLMAQGGRNKPGVHAVSGASAAALLAERGDGSSVLPVVDARGTIDFSLAGVPASNLAVRDQLGRNSFVKAWALIQCNNTTSPTVLAAQNVSGVTQAAGGVITVTFAQPMASNIYVPITQCLTLNNTFPLSPTSGRQPGYVDLWPVDTLNALRSMATLNGHQFYVAILGSM